MGYKNKNEMLHISLRLSDNDKIKLDYLVDEKYASFGLSRSKIINKILIDYLNTIPNDVINSNSNKALIDDTEASKDTKTKRHTNTTKDTANSSK